MNKLLQGVVVGCLLCSSSAYAEEDDAFEVSANVAVVSKYMWRGWVLNDEISAQGGFDVAYGGFSAGIWGGSDKALGTEYDLYFNYGREINEHVSWDVGFIQYRYPDKAHKVWEWHIGFDFNYFSVTYHKGEDAYDYLEFNKSVELGEKWSVDLHYGFEDNGSADWKDAQVLLNYQIDENYTVFFGISDKDRVDNEFWAGLQGVF